jgi:hypothetical protein
MLRDWLKSTLSVAELVTIVEMIGFLFGGDFATTYFEMKPVDAVTAAIVAEERGFRRGNT